MIVCERRGDGFYIESPMVPRGYAFGAIGITAAVLFSLCAYLAKSVPFALVAAVLSYASACALFERCTATVDRESVKVRREPIPMWPRIEYRGAVLGLETPAVSRLTRYGKTRSYPIVVRFADEKRVQIVDDAADAGTQAAVAGRISGELGFGIFADAPIASAGKTRRLVVALVATLGTAFVAILGFMVFMIARTWGH